MRPYLVEEPLSKFLELAHRLPLSPLPPCQRARIDADLTGGIPLAEPEAGPLPCEPLAPTLSL